MKEDQMNNVSYVFSIIWFSCRKFGSPNMKLLYEVCNDTVWDKKRESKTQRRRKNKIVLGMQF